MSPQQSVEMARLRVNLVLAKLNVAFRGDNAANLIWDAQSELKQAQDDLISAYRELTGR